MDFTSLESLAKHLELTIDRSLKNDVAKGVVKTMQEEIKDKVYSVYSPLNYDRHYYKDGLLDPKNIEIQVTDHGISVESIRYDENDPYKNVSEIIESGSGYTYNVPDELTNGRPFTESTRQRLVNEGILQQKMKDGLNRQGIDVRL